MHVVKDGDAITVGKYLVADERIIKGYAAYLYAKKKIKRKPRPIGIEVKDLCCGECKIVVGLELVETPDKQQKKGLMSLVHHVRLLFG